MKIFNAEAQIPKSDQENDTQIEIDLHDLSKKGTSEGTRVCTWLCMSRQILNFPRIFVKTHLDPPQRRPGDVLRRSEQFATSW